MGGRRQGAYPESMPILPPCQFTLDPEGFAPVHEVIRDEGVCRWPSDLRGFVVPIVEVGERGREAEGGWKAEYGAGRVRPKETPMSAPVQHEAPEAEVQHPTTASVAAPPPPSPDDLARVASQAGGGATGVAMALIAVVGGGGAIWKFLQSRQKAAEKRDELAHEARMKELELQAQGQQKSEDQHKACEAARTALASDVAALKARVEASERGVSEAMAKVSGSGEEAAVAMKNLSKRISKVETALKKGA